MPDAFAACKSNHMNGTWAIQALTSVLGDQLLSCKVILGTDRGTTTVQPESSCLLKYNATAQVKRMLGGNAALAKDCSFEIIMNVDPSGYIIMKGDLARNKQIANAQFNTNQLPENIQNNGYANYWGVATLVRK
jgi:hypothetical protein